MAGEPTTVNVGLIIPNTGDLVNLWGAQAINPDMAAIDGFQGGVQTISVASTPVTLTVPAGFTATPGAGPTQAQNAVLRFTGALASNVTVTLPMPGPMIIENLTTGNFVLSFRAATATQVIAIDQGEIQRIYNDGANVRFVGLGRVGHIEMWAGLSAIPAWVSACTVPPYLLCDGSVYNFSVYPYLGARLGSKFGGNGITTFGVPDLGGRVPLAYDQTGTRITVAGCGINGQTLGASQDKQTNSLAVNQIPPGVSSGMAGTAQPRAPNAGYQIPMVNANVGSIQTSPSGSAAVNVPDSIIASAWTSDSALAVTGTATSVNASQAAVNNVQPAQVTGIPVIRAA